MLICLNKADCVNLIWLANIRVESNYGVHSLRQLVSIDTFFFSFIILKCQVRICLLFSVHEHDDAQCLTELTAPVSAIIRQRKISNEVLLPYDNMLDAWLSGHGLVPFRAVAAELWLRLRLKSSNLFRLLQYIFQEGKCVAVRVWLLVFSGLNN
jgi:hypothetical protein